MRFFFCLLGFLSCCAWAEENLENIEKNSESTVENRDSWEAFNRKMFKVHTVVYKSVVKPVAQTYGKIVPLPVHVSLNNAFSNPTDLWVGANNLLQGKPKSAGSDVLRFLINSTLGIFGVFDVASEMGIAKNDEDFGQTLAVWGVPPGKYLFIPGIGPKYTRDAIGWLVDSNPLWWVISPIRARNIALGVNALETTVQILPLYQMVEESGIDPYVMIRESYFQRRNNQIWDGEAPITEEEDDYSKE